MEKVTFTINGMSCGHCVMSVTKALKGVTGVGDANVDLGAKLATVLFDPSKTSLEALKEAVRDAGYQPA